MTPLLASPASLDNARVTRRPVSPLTRPWCSHRAPDVSNTPVLTRHHCPAPPAQENRSRDHPGSVGNETGAVRHTAGCRVIIVEVTFGDNMVDTMMMPEDPDEPETVETRAVGKMTSSGYRWVAHIKCLLLN